MTKTFAELVEWSQGFILGSIPAGSFNQAVAIVCERATLWRKEQDVLEQMQGRQADTTPIPTSEPADTRQEPAEGHPKASTPSREYRPATTPAVQAETVSEQAPKVEEGTPGASEGHPAVSEPAADSALAAERVRARAGLEGWTPIPEGSRPPRYYVKSTPGKPHA